MLRQDNVWVKRVFVPLLAFASLLPDVARAHSHAQHYVLPIPFWMYIYASLAVLILSFAALAYIFAVPVSGTPQPSLSVQSSGIPRRRGI
jgi:hypothetical protein